MPVPDPSSRILRRRQFASSENAEKVEVRGLLAVSHRCPSRRETSVVAAGQSWNDRPSDGSCRITTVESIERRKCFSLSCTIVFPSFAFSSLCFSVMSTFSSSCGYSFLIALRFSLRQISVAYSVLISLTEQNVLTDL
ncbi:uncharacterized protein G2W53_020017 [Senna tora]|uniref:Uncharacterized protein n=1 Tax=Senna tora TaxID=362788 RepID=A0A834TUN2_9FABA|nr:uncharacterized protein G2W53_020017 [Senna tora]